MLVYLIIHIEEINKYLNSKHEYVILSILLNRGKKMITNS